tara:strand:+ start:2055 stop:2279 length:225 start_codon:yes stop_codon:yes gene_type:complete
MKGMSCDEDEWSSNDEDELNSDDDDALIFTKVYVYIILNLLFAALPPSLATLILSLIYKLTHSINQSLLTHSQN